MGIVANVFLSNKKYQVVNEKCSNDTHTHTHAKLHASAMSGGVTSASPWEQLLTYPDIAVDERIEAAVTESMAPETLQEAIATVVDEQWDTNTLGKRGSCSCFDGYHGALCTAGVYNILSHANLITSVEKRVDVLLKALNGRVTALILAAAVYIGNSGPVCLGTRQADVIPVLVRVFLSLQWPL